MRAVTVKEGGEGASDIDGRLDTLVLAGKDIVSISVKRFPMQYTGQRPAGLGTDSDIGGRAGSGGGRAGERRLQKVP